jgi:lipopolysaccharide export system ATP-binding protein
MPTLELNELVKIYNKRRVVNSVSLKVDSGKVIGLLGPNGAGKSTTFYMAVGLIRPDEGQVMLDGREVTGDPMHVRARKGIGYLPQDASVFKKLSAKDNIRLILECRNLPKSDVDRIAHDLLTELGISQLEDQHAAVLSGGERRRLEIARALASDPSFILLDEPFAGIDPLAIIDLKHIIIHLKNRNIGVLISDHNVRDTLGVCDEAYILSDGKIIESGSPDKIAASSTARRIYLGEEFKL